MQFDVQFYKDKFYRKPPKSSSVHQTITWFFNNEPLSNFGLNSLDDFKFMFKKSGALKPWNSFSNSSSVFMVDFDSDTNAKTELELAESYKLIPTLAYKTLSENYDGTSNKKITKFRFVYIVDSKITDINEYESLLDGLKQLFPNADKTCFNTSRWFYTGKYHVDSIFFETNILNYDNFKLNIISRYAFEVTEKTLKKRISKSCNNVTSSSEWTNNTNICQLWNELQSGIKINHDCKVLLLTSFININGGEKVFLNSLIDGVNTKSQKRWKSIVNFAKNKDYKPLKCNYACPYVDKCNTYKNYGTLYSALTSDEIKDESYISIDNARNMFSNMLQTDINTNDLNTIYVYQIPAGLGKTTEIINNYIDTSIIAFSNHSVLNEKKKLIKTNCNYTSSIKEIVTDSNDMKQLVSLYNTHNTKGINEIIVKYPGGQEYLRVNGKPITNNTVATHDKIFSSNFDDTTNRIIFDEDPTPKVMFKIFKYTIADIRADIKTLYINSVISKTEYDKIYRFATNVHLKYTGVPKPYVFKGDLKKELADISFKVQVAFKKKFMNIKTNIIDFLIADTYNNKSYSIVKTFPKNKAIYIMSATPDTDLINAIAVKSNMNVVYRNIPKVKREGLIKQVVANTSKKSLTNNKDTLKSKFDDTVTITYKNMVNSFNNTNEFIPYGGNALGFDFLKGINTNVACTYQLPANVYFHKYAFIHNKPVSSTKLKHVPVKNGTHKFMFYTYEDTFLRNIVTNHIDNEMIQSIERSRTLTEKVTTTVYSKFICSIVEPSNIDYSK